MAAGSCRFLFPPGGGEVDRERRPLPRRGVHEHQAAVRVHGTLHDGEAEAGAAHATRHKRLEQAGPPAPGGTPPPPGPPPPPTRGHTPATQPSNILLRP